MGLWQELPPKPVLPGLSTPPCGQGPRTHPALTTTSILRSSQAQQRAPALKASGLGALGQLLQAVWLGQARMLSGKGFPACKWVSTAYRACYCETLQAKGLAHSGCSENGHHHYPVVAPWFLTPAPAAARAGT